MDIQKKETNTSNILLWVIAIVIMLAAVKKELKSNKPYHSDVYSSWEEERIDELECDIAYLMDRKNRY